MPTAANLLCYPDVTLEVAIEVFFPPENRRYLLAKITEYLEAGVEAPIVIDLEARRAVVYSRDKPEIILGENEVLTIPVHRPGLEIRLQDVFSEDR